MSTRGFVAASPPVNDGSANRATQQTNVHLGDTYNPVRTSNSLTRMQKIQRAGAFGLLDDRSTEVFVLARES
jgi:hypothetical protein